MEGLPPLTLLTLGGNGGRPLLDGRTGADRSRLELSSQTPKGSVTFFYQEGDIRIRRTYTFYNQDYRVDISQDVEGLSGYQVALGSSFGIFNELEGGYSVYIGPTVRIGHSLIREDYKDFEGERSLKGFDWLGIQDKYFMAALIPPPGVSQGYFRLVSGKERVFPFTEDTVFQDRGRPIQPQELRAGDPVMVETDARGVARKIVRTPGGNPNRPEGIVVSVDVPSGRLRLKTPKEVVVAFQVAPGTGESLAYRLYAGPKELQRLKAQGVRLEDTVDFGYFSILAMPMFYVMQWIHGVTGNYGIAIIGLTVLLKILFFYPTHLSYKSMKAMQALQPKMMKIREKYKNDPKRMNQEMMELYKKHKVNPLGGCLPILIQIPFFIALYNVLSLAIELRRAPFVWWIEDLSVQDPYYILPVLMGVSMYISQKMTPSTVDPRQQRILMLMPVIFTFLFMTFPSGLVLYWLINNVLTIAQQIYINKYT